MKGNSNNLFYCGSTFIHEFQSWQKLIFFFFLEMRTCMTTLAPEWSDQEKKYMPRGARGWRTLNLVLRRDAMQFAFWASHRNLLWNEKLGKIFFYFFSECNFTIFCTNFQFFLGLSCHFSPAGDHNLIR